MHAARGSAVLRAGPIRTAATPSFNTHASTDPCGSRVESGTCLADMTGSIVATVGEYSWRSETLTLAERRIMKTPDSYFRWF
jgi:hypothetical protein